VSELLKRQEEIFSASHKRKKIAARAPINIYIDVARFVTEEHEHKMRLMLVIWQKSSYNIRFAKHLP